MIELVFIFLLSFLCCMFLLPLWIIKCRKIGLLWEDMNKYNSPKNVAASGGLIVLLSFLAGVFGYIAFRTFYLGLDLVTISILSMSCVVLIASLIGFVDDMLGWKNKGLSNRLRVAIVFMASIPLIVINAGEKIMNIPFWGAMDFGIFYPIVLIPLGVVGVTTVYNFLAGFNGLEAGQGILILSFLSYVAYTTGNGWLTIVGLCMVISLIPFLLFNWTPARVFGGDVLTYSVGAVIVSMAILGNFEKIAFIVFIPYIIEMLLKLRGGLKMYSFGSPHKDGSLSQRYNKIYGLTHLGILVLSKIKNKVYEKDVVLFILGIQVLFILLALTMI